MRARGATVGPWSYHTFTEGQWYRWRLDGAEVFLKNLGSTWSWATRPKHPEGLRRDFGGPEPCEPPPPELEVKRAIAASQPMALRPFALTKPFVVVPHKPVTLLAGEEIEFLVDVPVSVRWVTGDDRTLAHPNTIELHKTWFGDTTAGRLCFLWPTELDNPQEPPYGSMVRSRIVLRNHGRASLLVRQFPIYCEYLSLWEFDSTLRTDQVLVEGLNDQSLRVSTVPYPARERDVLLYEAVVTQSELLFQRGVDFLRSIAGIS